VACSLPKSNSKYSAFQASAGSAPKSSNSSRSTIHVPSSTNADNRGRPTLLVPQKLTLLCRARSSELASISIPRRSQLPCRSHRGAEGVVARHAAIIGCCQAVEDTRFRDTARCGNGISRWVKPKRMIERANSSKGARSRGALRFGAACAASSCLFRRRIRLVRTGRCPRL
jgi:hypothetical protein